MKRLETIAAIAVMLGLFVWLFLATRSTSVSPKINGEPNPVATKTIAPVVSTNSPTSSRPGANGKSELLIGESILRGYAAAGSPPQNDLTLMARLMDNYTLLVKSSAQLPMSANEDWAAAFRGKNPARERFLPDAHVALNPAGQLVDRWQSPLFFHALGNHQFEIRSAGPDKKLWTEDDIHRNADGSFLRGAKLNAASLFSGSGQPQSQTR